MSIDFKSSRGIFQQIADNLCHQILEGKLLTGERVPSVRELAGEFEVNRNTLLRTYALLEESGIIVNKRGVGFFVAENATELIKSSEKQFFFENDLPDFLKKVKLLNLKHEDLAELINLIQKNTNEDK